jgi:lipoyl(octanoyl) transferase
MQVFEKLLLWIDPVPRTGPETMAVDDWLLETTRTPVLRIYQWLGNWASIGYFGKIAEAKLAFPGVDLVRRWTGGGIVDHRADWTYTVVAPHGEPLAGWRGAESYRRIHLALVETLTAEGIAAQLSSGSEETGAMLCFENPVSHDLLGPDGRKLAGAGQRRTRQGLLHQGSVALDGLSTPRAESFASRLAAEWEHLLLRPGPDEIAQRMVARYSCREWRKRR